ncbi:hypothetical protein IG631_06785 [Alternaria alternata]|nr:hypothetical protein IG631_06785 [Alternaria alternata]
MAQGLALSSQKRTRFVSDQMVSIGSYLGSVQLPVSMELHDRGFRTEKRTKMSEKMPTICLLRT